MLLKCVTNKLLASYPYRLIFAGKQMSDDKCAKVRHWRLQLCALSPAYRGQGRPLCLLCRTQDYNIEGGSVLHLVLALRGGF